MKKIAILALLAAAATSASAQSSVTLFGIVDASARSTKNGDNTVKSLSSGGLSTSRFGVRGVEDLGGGLTGGFWLEAGLNIDTGATSETTSFFNRRATVSIMGALGELRLGRDTTPTYTAFSDFDVFGDNGVAASGKFYTALGTNINTNNNLKRTDNLISYALPKDLGGVYGAVAVAAGEGSTVAAGAKKYVGGRLGYAAGPLNLSAAASETLVAPVRGSDKYKVMSFGASYDLGMVKLLGNYSENKFAAQKVNIYSVGATVPVGLGQFRADYIAVDAKGAGIDANNATQIAVGYVYNLSKRTALYGTVAKVDNKANARYVVDSSSALPTTNTGKDSTGYEIGVRHAF